ncbi:EamA family transporter [Chloroflexota bacterium]
MKINKLWRVSMFALTLVAVCIIFGAVGQILMKNGMSQVGSIGGLGRLLNTGTIVSIFTNYYVLGGLLLYAVASFLWLGALSSLNVSFMYPLLSIGYVITAILGAVFLKEDITLLRWGGILFVVIGCFMILRT